MEATSKIHAQRVAGYMTGLLFILKKARFGTGWPPDFGERGSSGSHAPGVIEGMGPTWRRRKDRLSDGMDRASVGCLRILEEESGPNGVRWLNTWKSREECLRATDLTESHNGEEWLTHWPMDRAHMGCLRIPIWESGPKFDDSYRSFVFVVLLFQTHFFWNLQVWVQLRLYPLWLCLSHFRCKSKLREHIAPAVFREPSATLRFFRYSLFGHSVGSHRSIMADSLSGQVLPKVTRVSPWRPLQVHTLYLPAHRGSQTSLLSGGLAD